MQLLLYCVLIYCDLYGELPFASCVYQKSPWSIMA
jgi:hypothetical protein